MELNILLSILGFVVVSLIGIITWLAKSVMKKQEELLQHAGKTETSVAVIATNLKKLEETVGKETERLEKMFTTLNNQVLLNTNEINDINKKVFHLLGKQET